MEICVLYKGGLYMIKVLASSREKPIDVNINGNDNFDNLKGVPFPIIFEY